MAWWQGAAKAGKAVARGTQGLRDASRVAEAQAAGGVPAPGATGGHDLGDLAVTPAEALLLVRYIGGRATLGQIQPFGVGKYAFLALAVTFLVFVDASRAFVALFVGIFLLAALAQAVLTRAVRRFGLLDELSGLDSAAAQARTAWWPNLQRELRRVGIDPRPWSLLRLGTRHATRRSTPEQRAAFDAVDWLQVMPLAQWQEARRLLADARPDAGDTP